MRIGIVLAVLAFAARAGAEPRRTTVTIALRKKPGEKQPAIIKLAAHTAVVVEAEAGRWLRVRVGRVVGYLPRTVVRLPDFS